MGQLFRARKLSGKVKIKENSRLMFNCVIGVWTWDRPGPSPGSATH